MTQRSFSTEQADDEQPIRDLCTYMVENYPKATLQDVYKTCYQDYFGAGHIVSDTTAAHQYLSAEIAACADADMGGIPSTEPTGFRHRFVRVNLSEILNGTMSEEELFAHFVAAANQSNALGDNWASEWQQIETIAIAIQPEWADSVLQENLHMAASRNGAVRHSDAFRNAYNPHYRIIQNN